MEYNYKVHRIPTSDSNALPFLAGKFAALRLSALTTSPASFGATFEVESGLPPSHWITRLQRQHVNTFVAVAYAAQIKPEDQTIDRGDWIGCATLIGPTSKAIFELLESGATEVGADDVESKYHMTFVYSSPTHRNKGIAKMIIRAALDFCEQEAGPEKRSRARIMIAPDNVLVKGLYSGLGFLPAGNCTRAEAFVANGEEYLLPADGGASDPEKYNTRLGIVMETIKPGILVK